MQWVEDKVRAILNPFIDSDIQLSVWQGDLTLRNVQLRVEALDELDLDLPMKVHGAFAGKIHVSLPLRALFGKQPISVTIDQLYIVAGGFSELDDAADLGMDNAEALAEKQRKVKRAVIDAWQVMQDKFKPPGSIGQRATVVDRLASWLISRIRIDIRNVHVRLQEALSDLSGSHAGAAAEGRTASEPQLVLGCVLKSLRLDELPPEEVVHARPRSEVVQQPERRDGGGEGSGEGEGEAALAAVVGLRRSCWAWPCTHGSTRTLRRWPRPTWRAEQRQPSAEPRLPLSPQPARPPVPTISLSTEQEQQEEEQQEAQEEEEQQQEEREVPRLLPPGGPRGCSRCSILAPPMTSYSGRWGLG